MNNKKLSFAKLNKTVALLLISVLIIFILGSGTASDDLLYKRFSSHFLIGGAVAAGEWGGNNSFKDPGNKVLSEFNSITPGNCMKPEPVHPRPGYFQWGPADLVVSEAGKRGISVRGHVLVWHNQTPAWMFESDKLVNQSKYNQSKQKETARSNMKNHIQTLVGRYRGKIYAWDVVNEAISDGSDIYRKDSPWYRAYGDSTYIVDAFDFAREADPAARLYYNDYNLVIPDKRKKVVNMIRTLKLKEHGLTGVGIQAHWNLEWPSTKDIKETIDTFSRMGLDVQITELDIDCYKNGTEKKKPYSPELEKKLARRYREIFKVFEEDSDKISSITFWGLCDDDSWLNTFNGNSGTIPYRENYPLLFDKEGKRKLAYYYITDSLR